jgi:hypothetical protein
MANVVTVKLLLTPLHLHVGYYTERRNTNHLCIQTFIYIIILTSRIYLPRRLIVWFKRPSVISSCRRVGLSMMCGGRTVLRIQSATTFALNQGRQVPTLLAEINYACRLSQFSFQHSNTRANDAFCHQSTDVRGLVGLCLQVCEAPVASRPASSRRKEECR